MSSTMSTTRKVFQAGMASLFLSLSAVSMTAALPTAAHARGGGDAGGADGGEGGAAGEGSIAGVYFREQEALRKALKYAAHERRRGRRPPRVRTVRPWQDHDCDYVRFRATKAGPRYHCEIAGAPN